MVLLGVGFVSSVECLLIRFVDGEGVFLGVILFGIAGPDDAWLGWIVCEPGDDVDV